MNTITTYTSTRTEDRRADTLREGDHILDPNDGRSILTIWRVEPLGGMIYFDAMKRRSVMRRVAPSQMIAVCVPMVHAR